MINTSHQVVARIDPHVRALLRELEAVWDEVVAGASAPATGSDGEPALPVDHGWVESGELKNQKDIWPGRDGGNDVTKFDRFPVFQRGDGLRLGLGYVNGGEGRLEGIGVFLVRPNDQKRLIVYFQRTDDYKQTRELWAPIRGKAGGRSYFRGMEKMPPHYAGMNIVQLKTVAAKHRLGEINVLLIDEGDTQAMLDHGAAQIALRNLS
jgi:hypothetical protein